MQDGKPVYERAFALKKSSAESFADGKLFFAEYFSAGTPQPQVIVDEKESGRYAVRTAQYYHYIDNPNQVRGRVITIMDIRYSGDSCFVKVYDWQVQRSGTAATWVATPSGYLPKGEVRWEDRDEEKLVADAAAGRQSAVAETKVIDKKLRAMLDAFAKKLGK